MRNKVLVFSIILILLSALYIFNPKITGFLSLSSKDFEFNLTRDNYLINESLEGVIKLNLYENVDPNTVIKVDIDEKEIGRKTLSEILDLMLKDTELIGGDFVSVNKSREMVFENESLFGFVVPAGSSIEKFNFNIEGLSVNTKFPSNISIDLGDDGDIDWYYLGNFNGFSNEIIKPKGLNDLRGNDVIIDSNTDLYCELFNLDFANLFKVNSDFEVIIDGNLKATVLQFDNSDFVFPGADQDCSFNDLEFGSTSCVVQSSNLLIGEYLVCVYNSGNTGEFKLKTDTKSESGFICDLANLDFGSSTCDSAPGDFKITLSKAIYDNVLNNRTSFGSLKLGELEPAQILDDAKCDDTNCVIPARIKFNNGGIKVNGVSVKYKDTGVSFETADVHLIKFSKSLITAIGENKLVNNVTLEIPFSVFEINVVKGGNIKVFIENSVREQKFNVVADISGLSNFDFEGINKRIDKLTKLEAEEEIIKSYFELVEVELSAIKGKLATLENRLKQVDNSNFSVDQRFEEIEKIDLELEDTIKDIPESLTIKTKVNNVPTNLPEDFGFLEGELETQKDEIISAQDQVDITSIFASLIVGDEEFTLILRDVSTGLGEIDVVESIPKSAVANANEIKFGNAQVVENDPVLKFTINNLGKISYLIPGDVLFDLGGVTTLVVPKDLGKVKIEEPIEGAVCGDNVCTEFYEDSKVCPQDCRRSYWWLIILIMFLVLVMVSVSIYMRWIDISFILNKKPKFSSEKDYLNLKSYVKNSLTKGKKIEEIRQILLGKGWKKEQVDYVIKKTKK